MADDATPVSAAPGWYSDPEMAGTQRYWDGQQWTDHRAPGTPTPERGPSGPRHWRKMTWVLIAWSALILVWAIGGGSSAQDDCGPTQLSQDACDAGTAIGVGIVLFIGFIGFVFFSIIWFMTRPRQ